MPAPITALPHASLRSLRGLIFDVDGTVTEEGRLSPEAFCAMWDLHRSGIILIAATGRPLGWARVMVQHWPVAAALGENGAGWHWRNGESVRTAYFASEVEREGHAVLLERIRGRVAKEMPGIKQSEDSGLRVCDLAFDIGETQIVPEQERAALRALMRDEGATVTESSVHMHAVPGEWDKASGLERALAGVFGVQLQEEIDRWVYVGDSANDASAFARFPLSVGVANVMDAGDALTTLPAFITDAAEGAGFAELARCVLAARR